jgi:hypothetical protein
MNVAVPKLFVGAIPNGPITNLTDGLGTTSVDVIDGNGTSLICILMCRSPKARFDSIETGPIIGLTFGLETVDIDVTEFA